MFKRILPAAVIGYLFLVIVNWGCTKLDTTTLGGDLIPEVDNVNTFRDTFDITSTQNVFNDTFKVTSGVTNVLGTITDDPLIGSTQAHMFLQFKPVVFPFSFKNTGEEIIGLDSIVLCLNYVGFWGDSSKLQKLQVYAINQQDFADQPTTYRTIQYQPAIFPTPISNEVSFDVRKFKDTIRINKDSVTNQIRIRLNDNFAQTLFNRDSIENNPANNAYYTDSIFRRFYNGFAIKSIGGTSNGLMYINPLGGTTRLEIHFKKKLANGTTIDTTRANFTVLPNSFGKTLASASSNYVNRAFASNVTDPASSDLHLVTGPGTYANLSIPALTSLSNRIVHRAEIYMEQNPENSTNDTIFYAPPYMYLDVVDTPGVKWKPLYYDLSPNEGYDPDNNTAFQTYYPLNGGVDFTYFGGISRVRYNYLGQKVVYYTLNITRHVQRIITRQTPNYTLRLFPAYSFSYPQFTAGVSNHLLYNNSLAQGRVRLKGGSYPDKQLKMNLIMTWSKVN